MQPSQQNLAKEAGRIEAFSDAVFAIAITLLIIEIKVPTEAELQNGLLQALLDKWHGYLAFFIGFFTIMVSWINHHYLFNHISLASQSLILSNSYLLFLISFVPFPTAILAQSFHNDHLETGVQLYGITYFLMSSAFRILSASVNNNRNTEYTFEEKKLKKALHRMYEVAMVHTALTFFISFYSVVISLILYVLLFTMFLFPEWYVHLIMRHQSKNK